jgi:hypothetical protein
MNIPNIKLPLPHGCMGMSPSLLKKPCALGCDIRPGSFDVLIGDIHCPAPDRKILRLVFAGKVRDERDVIWLAHQYPVRCGVVDSRPEGTLAKRLVERMIRARKDFWRAQYATNPSAVEMSVNQEERLLTLERTMTLDSVFFGFSTGLGVAIPQNFKEITAGKFKSELCASTRSPVMWKNQPWYRWTENCADHAFHAWNYMLVAAVKCGLDRLTNSDSAMAQPGLVVSGGRGDEFYERGDDMDPDGMEAGDRLDPSKFRPDKDDAFEPLDVISLDDQGF